MLGLTVDADDLPTTITCPKCRGNTLQLFDDILTNGVWFHCIGCAAHGDSITFGAEIWNISIQEAADKFVSAGLTTKTNADRRLIEYSRAIEKHRAANDFMLDAYGQLWDHGNDIITSRLRELGLRYETAINIELVGVAQKPQIDAIAKALNRQKAGRYTLNTPGIVFPFFDLPGRLSGFLIVQYDGHLTRQSFIQVNAQKRGKTHAGYYLLPALYTGAHPTLKQNQFISDDVFWVTKLQAAALTRNGKLLPAVGSYANTEVTSFGAPLAANDDGKNRIFHGVALTPTLASRAATARGYLSTARLDLNNPSLQQLATIKQNAKTWKTALIESFKTKPKAAAESFARRLTIPAEKITKLFEDNKEVIPFDIATSVTASIEAAQIADTPSRTSRRITERTTGWWTHTGRHVCNVRPIIEEVVHLDDGESFYKGVIHTETATYQFEERAKKIENTGLLAYARLVLADEGELVIFNNRWNAAGLNIALRLHPPKITRVTNKYGWDANSNTFRFCQYALDHQGEIKPHTTLKPIYDKLKDFAPPELIGPDRLDSLTAPTADNIFVWLFTASVLSNLLAVVLRSPVTALALSGAQIEKARDLAANLGCATELIPPSARKRTITALWDQLPQTAWPTLFSGVFNQDMLSLWAPGYFNQPLILGVNKAAQAVLPGYDWHTIAAEPSLAAQDYTPIREILPAYIQYVLQNKAEIIKTRQITTLAVLKNLHSWLRLVYAKTFNLELAITLLITPDKAHTALARELNAAINDDKIAVLPLPRQWRQPQNYFLKTTEYWWLNRWAVERYFRYAKSPTPNWIAFVARLQENGAFIDEQVVNGNPGLLVQPSWFENCCQRNLIVQKETG